MSRKLVVLSKDAGDSSDHHKRISTWLFQVFSVLVQYSVYLQFQLAASVSSTSNFSLQCQIESVVLFTVHPLFLRNILEA